MNLNVPHLLLRSWRRTSQVGKEGRPAGGRAQGPGGASADGLHCSGSFSTESLGQDPLQQNVAAECPYPPEPQLWPPGSVQHTVSGGWLRWKLRDSVPRGGPSRWSRHGHAGTRRQRRPDVPENPRASRSTGTGGRPCRQGRVAGDQHAHLKRDSAPGSGRRHEPPEPHPRRWLQPTRSHFKSRLHSENRNWTRGTCSHRKGDVIGHRGPDASSHPRPRGRRASRCQVPRVVVN